MNVIDIIAEYLIANKYDGLCLPEHGCACLLEDLAPCAAISEKCRSGHCVNVSADTPCLCDESGTDHWHIEADDASGQLRHNAESEALT
jgi:hypothetical protein